MISDRSLERYLLGELGEEERARVDAELRRDPGLSDRLEQIRASDREILDRYPPAEMARAIQSRLERPAHEQAETAETAEPVEPAEPLRIVREPSETSAPRPGRRFPAAVLVPLAAVAVFLAILLPLRLARDDSDGLRIKGLDSRLVIHRQTGSGTSSGAEQLESGATARAGDVLQISYVSAEARYGVILSIDGNGIVTYHLPESGADAAPLETGGLVALPYAYQLDAAPSFERFFFVTSERPFSLEDVDRAARELASSPARAAEGVMSLPRALDQTTFILRKPEG